MSRVSLSTLLSGNTKPQSNDYVVGFVDASSTYYPCTPTSSSPRRLVLILITTWYKAVVAGRMFILLFFGLSLLSGCGYHLTTDKDPSLIAGKTIAIPVWRSKVYRPFMETVLTDSLLKEFSIRSGGQVVGVEAADVMHAWSNAAARTAGLRSSPPTRTNACESTW